MKKHAAIKNIILLLIMLTVIIDGLFFGDRESIELSDNYGFRCTADANNETGIIQPVEELGELLATKGIFFHVDATQTCGKLVPELKKVKYDMLSMSAHKMYGAQGVGALILKKKEI